MRVENLNWGPADRAVKRESRKRAIRAGNRLVQELRKVCPVGTRSTPLRTSGKYAGKDWTKHDAGALKKSIRTSTKRENSQLQTAISREVLVIAGHHKAYYAAITEHDKPWFRPTVERMRGEMNRILEGKE